MLSLDKDFVESIIVKYGPLISKLNLSNNGLKDVRSIVSLRDKGLLKLNLSKNAVHDIFPIGQLTSLLELNLAENNIESLSDLKDLTNLENLDISGNNISRIDSMDAIRFMPRLTTLNLRGNPICISANYPYEIFTMQPKLQFVDEWSREDVLHENLTSGCNIESSSSRPNQIEKSALVLSPENVRSLEAQVASFSDAFAIQEKALSSNGQEATQYCFSHNRLGNQHDQASIVENFPYYRLLQLWRQKVLSSAVQTTLLEQRLKEVYSSNKQERELHVKSKAETEAQLLKWKSQSQANHEKCEMLSSQLHSAMQQIEKGASLSDRQLHQLGEYQVAMRSIATFLAKFRKEMDRKQLFENSKVSEAAQKLVRYERRIESLAEKIELLQDAMVHKELYLRNSIAAVEAEKRLQQLRYSQQVNAELGVVALTRQSEDSISEDHPERQSQREMLLSDLALSPDAEILLKALFRTLDMDDAGFVTASILKEGIFEESNNALTPIGKLLSSALSQSQLESLSAGLARLAGENRRLCWGEVLLQLIPTPRTRAIPLTAKELSDLQRANLVESFSLGIAPLDLSSPEAIISSSGSGSGSGSGRRGSDRGDVGGSGTGRSEAQQWRAERRFLQSRLQQMSRNSSRIAEEIKAYFESELRLNQIKESRMQATIEELSDQLTIAKRRTEEVELLLCSARETSDRRIHELERDIETLTKASSSKRIEEINKYEQMLQDVNNKLSRVETENSLLQRETSKKEVKNKALQRDLLRLQASQSAQANDLQSMQTEKSRLEASHAEVVAVLRIEFSGREQAWEQEKASLLTRISSLQEELIESNRARFAAEERERLALLEAERRQESEEEEKRLQQQQQQQQQQQVSAQVAAASTTMATAPLVAPLAANSDETTTVLSSSSYHGILEEMNSIRRIHSSLSAQDPLAHSSPKETPLNSVSGSSTVRDRPISRETMDLHINKLFRLVNSALAE